MTCINLHCKNNKIADIVTYYMRDFYYMLLKVIFQYNCWAMVTLMALNQKIMHV